MMYHTRYRERRKVSGARKPDFLKRYAHRRFTPYIKANSDPIMREVVLSNVPV
jgi:hypothetical protein